MALSAGSRLGPYEIQSSLGAGGMGEVYRAQDTKLGRDVAIKALPDLFAADRDHVARFEREAQLLASLNHPHIGAIHGLHEVDGSQFLILEFIDGQTLADRLASGPVPLAEAIPIARQIADALGAAHDKGIIHRDLKPANIMLTAEGDVKVLDFGLARAATPEMSASNVNSPTLTFAATQMGVILGTAAYMSPEQAKGRVADKRSDVWAFGCVLFEMLTGRRAFDGDDISDTLAAVLRDEPRWNELPGSLTPAIRDLLRGCLKKDRKQRIRDLSVVAYVLDQGDRDGQPARVTAARTPMWRYVAVIGGTAALTVGSASVMWRRPADPPRPVTRYAITLPPGTQFSNAGRNVVAISPDGNYIAYVANNQLNLRASADIDGHPIPGTSASSDLTWNSPRNPFFSPDGLSIGFWQGGELKYVSVNGGVPTRICTAPIPFGATWFDNMVVFGAGAEGILRAPATGGKPEVLVKVEPGESAHGPQMLPGGGRLLFTRARGSDWENADIVLQSLDSGSSRVVIEGGTDARYLETGHLVFARGRTLYATAFDLASGVTSGARIPVVDGVAPAQSGVTGASHFAIASDGTLVYAPRAGVLDAEPRQLVWVDRNGNEEVLSAPPRLYSGPRISPDGRRIAAAVADEGNLDVVTWDKERGLTQLTFERATDIFPVWVPNANRLVFASRRSGPLNVFVQPPDGTSAAVRLFESPKDTAPTDVSADGRYLVFEQRSPQYDLMLLKLEPQAEPQPLLSEPSFSERFGTISPDGRWIAYETDRRGQPEIWVKPFPNVNSADGWSVSPGGGRQPHWSRDRNRLELFYVALSGKSTGGTVMSRVNDRATWDPSPPTKVVQGDYIFVNEANIGTYDVAPDGRFLFIKPAPRSAPAISQRIIVVQHWFQELERLVPRR